MKKRKKGAGVPVTTKQITTKETAKKPVKALPFILFSLAVALACAIFSVLCIYQTNLTLLRQNRGIFSALSCLISGVFFLSCVILAVKGKNTLFKTCFSLQTFFMFCLILLFILLKTGFFVVIRSEESLREYLLSKGAWMPALYVVLQYLQVVVLPIPGTVSTLAGVALFGPFQTLIYSFIGIMLGSLTAFYIGRRLGDKAVSWIVGRETLDKWQTKLKGKDNLLLTIMFVLPVFPDDILCFVAGLSSMTARYFTVMLAISRFLAISATCYSVNYIPINTWWGLGVWMVFFAVILLLFLVVYKNLDKLQTWLSKRFKPLRKKTK